MDLEGRVSTKIPITFEMIEELDDRFMKFKIWVVNVGKNYNGSVFSKDAILKALPTIYNTPVLGFIKEDKLGNKDFAGHEVELVVKNGELHEHYLGHAYGVVPVNCNPQFEFRENELGGLEEYLTVEAIIWTKFDDAVDILNSSNGVKPHSMELSKNYTGKWTDEGFFEFDQFEFFGCTILGDNIDPAIPQSSIERLFSKSNFKEELENKISEYNHIFEKHLNHSKGVHDVDLESLLNKYNVSKEFLEESGIKLEEYSEDIKNLEEKIKTLMSDENEDSNDENVEGSDSSKENESSDNEAEFSAEGQDENNGDDEEKDENEEDEDPKNFSITFELSHDSIRSQIWNKIDSHMSSNGYNGDWFYVSQVFDDHAIVENDDGSKFYKVSYVNENDEIKLGDIIQVFPMHLTTDEKNALELMRSNFEKMEEENRELKEFKKNTLALHHESEVEELISSFEKLTDDDVKEIRENIHNYSIKEIESMLYEILGRKTAKFSKKKEKSSVEVKFSKLREEGSYSSKYGHLFEKHLGKK